MTTPTIVAGSTKHLLLNQWARRQSTALDAALEAGVSTSDYSRRTRELVSAGCLEQTGRVAEDGRNVLRITPLGRTTRKAIK